MIVKYYEPGFDGDTGPLPLAEKITALLQQLDPTKRPMALCADENWDRKCDDCPLWHECKAHTVLINLLGDRIIVCSCPDTQGLGHRETCVLGERGKKMRRQLEERLRKDPRLMVWLSAIDIAHGENLGTA